MNAMTEAQRYQQVLQQIETGVEPSAFSDYIGYLLIETTLNSLAQNQVPELVARVVDLGLWSVDYALEIVARIPDPQRKAAMYAKLLSTNKLSDQQQDSLETAAQETVKHIDFNLVRFNALLDLIPTLRPTPQSVALTQALELAFELATKDQWDDGKSLAALAPHLSPELLNRVVNDLTKIENPKAKAWAGAALARQLENARKQSVLEQSIDAALAIQDELYRANALSQLADQVTDALSERILQATLAITNEQWRPRVIEKLAGRLNDQQKIVALNASLAIQHPWYRAFALRGLIPYLTGDLLHQALDAAFSVESDEALALIISSIYFPADYQQIAINKAQSIQTDNYRFQALVGLASKLLETGQKSQILAIALDLALSPNTPPNSDYTMITLAQQLEEPAKHQVFARVLSDILEIEDEESRGYALTALAEHLPDDLLPSAVDNILDFEEDFRRLYVLGTYAGRLPVELLSYALDRVSVNDYESRVFTLVALAKYLTGEAKSVAIDYALRAVKNIKAVWLRIDPLLATLPLLEGDLKTTTTAYALVTVESLPNSAEKVSKLAALLDYLPQDQQQSTFTSAYNAASSIADPESRSRALTAIAEHATDSQKDEILSLALEAALTTSNQKPDYMSIDFNPRASALATVGSAANGTVLTRTLQVMLQEKPLFWQILMVLNRPFTEEQLALAQKLVASIDSKVCRGEALAVLAQHLHEQAKVAALDQAWEIAKTETHLFRRLELLKALVKQVAGQRQAEVVDLAIDLARQMEDDLRASQLIAFIPYASDKTRLLRELRMIILEDLRKLRDKTREEILVYCKLFQLPIVSESTLADITRHIINVCWPQSNN